MAPTPATSPHSPTSPLRRRSRGALATATIAAVVSSTFLGGAAAFAAPPTDVDVQLPGGRYVVVLDEPAAATYEGGESGLQRTAPEEGERLEATDDAVQEYVSFLAERQEEVAGSVGATADASYQIALNGFSAELTEQQATKLAAQRGVTAVYPDEILHPDAVLGTDFLGLSGEDGVWEQLGGIDSAGEGVVVGVVDTGIAPENPSFAGEPLGTSPGAEPYLDGNQVVFDKADGTQFRSDRVEGEEWTLDDYSTKIIGAQWFGAGAEAAGFGFDVDYRSPRDFSGHGSHTAGTAAGNNGVDATVGDIDYGAISGVAPAAKVASYKACYDGPDPSVTSDDICATSDLLAAINAAVNDGVDVLNFSIGGGAATTVLDAFDLAFLNAAAAGVFVSASAGNSGPGASTLDHASPWYTTVANSTLPSETATLTLGDGAKAAGLTIGLPADADLEGPIAAARASGIEGVDATLAAQCTDDTLDPAAVEGAIVVCERGGNFLYQKSDEVQRAGGIATIILNTPTTAQTIFGGSYSLPTVHIPSQFYAAITDYIAATDEPVASLAPGNETEWVAPAAPVVNSSSSRGPALAGGSDVLKPDISAPGTDILAPVAGSPGSPAWDFYTGTSMSAPHIVGIAALYLGENPLASPAEIKSAMMTTAYDTVNEDGSPNTDPFAHGAGHVDPTRLFAPGALYLNGLDDWYAYLQGVGIDAGVDPIDPSDLNIASISIGTLASTQTVTRTLTATQAGTMTASIDVPGIDAVVEPATVSFDAPGDTAEFTVTFTPTTAAPEQWATGSLTWSGAGNDVRSPVAVYPVTAAAPAAVEGEGTEGSLDVAITPGIDGELPLALAGLVKPELLTDPAFPVEGHTGDQDSFYDEGGQFNNYFTASVPEGAAQARFELDSSVDDGRVDLDMAVYQIIDGLAYFVGQSATESADEAVILTEPEAGDYLVLVNRYSASTDFVWDLTVTSLVPGTGEGSFTATPNPLSVTRGEEASFSVSWTGLDSESTYYGLVRYGESAVQTFVEVTTGEAPASAPVIVDAPTLSGTPVVGRTLTATPGTWNPADVSTEYQWLRDGEPIEGATAATYKVVRDDQGTALSVRVTATAAGSATPGVAESASVFVKNTSSTKVTLNRYLGTSSQQYVVTVKVEPSAGAAASGDVSVWVNDRRYDATLDDAGTARIELPTQRRGVYVVVASYGGSDTVRSSIGLSGFVVLR